MNWKKKLAFIAGGALLLSAAAVSTFFLLKRMGGGDISGASGEAAEKRAPAPKESREPKEAKEPKESREPKEAKRPEEPEENASGEPSKPGREEGALESSREPSGEKSSGEQPEENASGENRLPGRLPGQREEDGKGGTPGPLQVVGTGLCDSMGNPVQLRGVSTHGLAWFPDYVNEELFRELHEQWNVNVIRLAMYTAEYGGYCSGGDQDQLKQLIRDGVEYASNQNMYVIIDWHILSDGDPNTYREEAKAFFREMSAEFADRDNVLYEICNEPNGGTGWSRVKEYAEEIIPVIRENDGDAVILVGTPNWCQYVDQAAADPITEWDNIMYTLHFYAATHKESLRQTMAAALDGGLPIFVSEYSICDASGNGGIDQAQAAAWVELMDSCGVSYVAWNLSNKNETSALFKSSCDKLNGFSQEDLSSTGQWLYGLLGGGGQSAGNESQSAGNESQPAGNESQPQGSGAQSGGVPAPTEGLKVTVQVVNSWESEGKHFYQCEMTVENISDKAIDGWQADIQFSEAPELSDSWNGVFTPEGSALHVSSVDYNGRLESGGLAENIGFIVSGGAGLTLSPE